MVSREGDHQGPDREWNRFLNLEPEFVVVVLAALVYRGDIVLNLAGREINASNLVHITRISLDELVNFRYYKTPPTLNIPALGKTSCSGQALPPGLINGLPVKKQSGESRKLLCVLPNRCFTSRKR